MDVLSPKLQRALQSQVEAIGFLWTSELSQLFIRYTELLLEWNAKINLTALRDAEKIVTHHFIDSLMVVAHLPNVEHATVIDVGSGGGFPGMVCAMMRPEWKFTLVERIQKKAAFLSHLSYALGLKTTVIAKDVQEVNQSFDVAMSRATFSPHEWMRIASPLVAPGGTLVVMVGQQERPLEEPRGFRKAAHFRYEVGQGQSKSHHTLLMFQKYSIFEEPLDLAPLS